MAGQVPAGQLRERAVAIAIGEVGRRTAQPVAHEGEGVPCRPNGSLHHQTAQDGREEQVPHRLAFGPDPDSGHPRRQLAAGHRAVIGQRPRYQGHSPLRILRGDALLTQATPVPRHLRRGRKPQQPRVVVAAHEMERPSVEPGHHERPVCRQRPIDGAGRQPFDSGSKGQPSPHGILCLHGEQVADCRLGAARNRVLEQLRS